MRALVDRLAWLGALPEPANGYQVEWPSLFTKRDTDRAKEAAQVAAALEKYARAAGIDASEVMSLEEFRERFLGLPRQTG